MLYSHSLTNSTVKVCLSIPTSVTTRKMSKFYLYELVNFVFLVSFVHCYWHASAVADRKVIMMIALMEMMMMPTSYVFCIILSCLMVMTCQLFYYMLVYY